MSIAHQALQLVSTINLSATMLGLLTIAILVLWKKLTFAALQVIPAARVAVAMATAVATDNLHSGVRSDLDKELSAQGVGNFVSGLLGGLPVTGVIVRSSANISANAATRWPGVFHGVWVLIFTLFFRRMIETIPLSVLG